VYILTGSLNVDERANNLNLFRQNGGILISTDALLEGVSLEFVDESINYDLPIDPTKLEQRWGRFLRIGRKSEFRMVFMRDKSKSLIWEEKLFDKLKDTISSSNPE
jgi:superfamily II DNA/RNA helicase